MDGGMRTSTRRISGSLQVECAEALEFGPPACSSSGESEAPAAADAPALSNGRRISIRTAGLPVGTVQPAFDREQEITYYRAHAMNAYIQK
jgi:hypothetical protein